MASTQKKMLRYGSGVVQVGAKKSNSEICHNFQGFSFFEVKLSS
jgi:hypothetical protein